MVYQQNEYQQPNEKFCDKSQNENHNEIKGDKAHNTGGQLKTLSTLATIISNYIMTTIRGCGKYWEKMMLISELLQDRYSQ